MTKLRELRVPMSFWPGLVVVAIGAVAVGVNGCSPEEDVPVPKADLPAFHRIVKADLKTRKVSRHDLDEADLRKREELIGRVTVAPVKKEAVVTDADVTASKPTAFAGLVPVAFHADSDSAGDPSSGESVRLLFAPKENAEGIEAVEVGAVLLATDDVESGGTDFVVAVRPEDRVKMLGVVARSRLLVVAAE